MTFTGLHPDAAAFYAELRVNNTKTWWLENKARYDDHVRAPFDALGAQLATEFGPLKTFRPYRDVRFSADKTPYKLHIGTVTRAPVAHYLQFSDEGIVIGGGVYDVPAAALKRFREIIDDNRLFGDLDATLDEVRADGFEPMTDGSLTTAPRGYSVDHPQIALLRLKRVAIGRSEPLAEWMWTPDAAPIIAARWRTVSVWNEWVSENLGTDVTGFRSGRP
ncbi:DUF2461 domain-containing protein [Microbacterium sp.]|uniref:DUF2461 domain-containing protein n=1 Tax=Microbacterium sp. TaxID=51671 RepID=UPI003A889E32